MSAKKAETRLLRIRSNTAVSLRSEISDEPGAMRDWKTACQAGWARKHFSSLRSDSVIC